MIGKVHRFKPKEYCSKKIEIIIERGKTLSISKVNAN